MIYAIRAGSDGPIKIGKATNPVERMATLQTAHHLPLNLLAAVRWPDDHEAFLHDTLKEWRLTGEWFEPSEQVLWAVERMRDYESVHELFFRFRADYYFPWMEGIGEPAAEYLTRRECGEVVGWHSKW